MCGCTYILDGQEISRGQGPKEILMSEGNDKSMCISVYPDSRHSLPYADICCADKGVYNREARGGSKLQVDNVHTFPDSFFLC